MKRADILLTALVFSLFISIIQCGCIGNITMDEYSALEALFYSTDGRNWDWKITEPPTTIWTFPSPLSAPCDYEWQGVICNINSSNESACAIVEIELESYNLRGAIPSELGWLTALEYLHLYENSLTGTIPEALGTFSLVLELFLYENCLTGSIPTQLSQLQSVRFLYYYQNMLTGTLPVELGSLTTMVTFGAFTNCLTGSIPTELANLLLMTGLQLEENLLTGTIPTELGSQLHLLELEFAGNSLEGTIPTQIGMLSSLSEIDFNTNQLVGTIPTEFGLLSSLRDLHLYDNSLTKTIPTELGAMSSLVNLYLDGNCLTGAIPTEIGLLSSTAANIWLDFNSLEGTIPTQLGLLTSLLQLALNSNCLVGNLPEELSRPTMLTNLALDSNALTGKIPTEYGLLTGLLDLTLNSNLLSASVPTELGALHAVQNLDFENNSLTGTIPSELGALTAVVEFYFCNNCLSGSLPSELAGIVSVQQFEVNSNLITGTIPAELLMGLKSLGQVYFSYNRLSGTFPSEIGLASSLELLYSSSNYFSGSLPSQLAMLESLQQMYFQNNYFSGFVPDQLGSMRSLQQVYLGYNMLEGNASVFGEIKRLQVMDVNNNEFVGCLPFLRSSVTYVNVQSNRFSGSLGDALSNCSRVEYVDFSSNLLTGTIPSYFTAFRLLESLNMSNNMFSGSIENAIINSGGVLHSVDLSNNQFSGVLSSAFFQQTSLQQVLLFGNCFSGSLPDELCDSRQLQGLFLSSLTGGCASRIPPLLRPIFQGSFPKRFLTGSIPSCVWNMSNLEELQLSGNGLRGSIGELGSNISLRSLVVSNNKLTGSIPLGLQTLGKLEQLDLSDNKLSGTLSDSFAMPPSATVFDLTVNRLSGRLPASFETAPVINVLNGNLWQCQKGNVPSQDPGEDTYTCGSKDLDLSLVFAAIGFVVVLLVTFVSLNGKRWIAYALDESVAILGAVRQQTWLVLLLSALQLLTIMLYIVFKLTSLRSSFSTHFEQYTWTPSVAFLHGWAPAFVVIVMVEICVYVAWMWETESTDATAKADASETQGIEQLRVWFRSSCMHLGNIAVVVAVNALYVSAFFNGASAKYLFAVQFFLGVFKLVWNGLAIPWVVDMVIGGEGLSHKVFMALFSFIGGPFISTFLTSSNCFFDVFNGQSSIDTSSTVEVYTCTELCVQLCTGTECHYSCNNMCAFNEEIAVDIVTTPPWVYSYQCASALVTNYIPVLVLSFSTSMLVCALLLFGLTRSEQTSMDKQVADFVNGQMDAALLLSASRVRMKYFLNVTVILTFGVASPLLAAIVAVESVIHACYLHSIVGRCLQQIGTEEFGRRTLRTRLYVPTIKPNATAFLIASMFVGVFWCLFMFDMIGDVYNDLAGGLATLIPIGLTFMFWLWKNYSVSDWLITTTNMSPGSTGGVEYKSSSLELRSTFTQNPLVDSDLKRKSSQHEIQQTLDDGSCGSLKEPIVTSNFVL